MLKKSRRLTSAQVTALLSSGRAVTCGCVRLRYVYRSENTKISRFSAIVSKKVAKRASGRNLLRRRAYAALATTPSPSKPIDGAIFVLKDASASLISADIRAALSQIK